jgi:hypothetical protein
MTLAAILVPLFINAGGPCEAYAVQRDTGSGWQLVPAYTATLAPKDPHPAPDTVWASISTARYATAVLRVGCACGPDVRWSNAVAIAHASAWPDTNAFLTVRGVSRGIRTPFRVSLPDSGTARIEHQETVQRRASRRLVEIFGYWLLAGRMRVEVGE